MSIVAGILSFNVGGTRYNVGGDYTVMPLGEKREPLEGMDGSVGMKVERKAPMIEGQIYDRSDLDVLTFLTAKGVNVTLELENGKAWVLRNAFYSGEGNINPGEATIDVRFHGESIEEVR